MRFSTHLMAIFLAISLTACGGGGGSDGTPLTGSATATTLAAVTTTTATITTTTVVSTSALRTDAPTDATHLTLASGTGSNTFTIFDGVPYATGTSSYRVNNSNPLVASATITGSTLTINGLTIGTAILLINDSVGKSITVTVDVVSAGALLSTAPSNLSLASGTSSSAYTISGGIPFAGAANLYSVQSSVPGLVSALVSGANLTITALANTAGGTANVIVSDSKGTKFTVVVDVKPPALFVDAPANIVVRSVAPNDTYLVTISGGVAPYTALSSDTAVASTTVPAANGKFTIQGLSAGSTLVVIKDAVNTPITLSVTVPASTALFSTAPATLAILSGTTNFYKVFGGTAPYAVNDNGNGVIAQALLSGSNLDTLSIKGLAVGKQTIAISDAKGAVISMDVTVNTGLFTDAPTNLTLANGTGSNTFTIFGGVPFSGAPPTYKVNSSNALVASAVVTGSNLTISGLSLGTAILTISDSVGSTTAITVAVPAAGALISTAPANLLLTMNTSGNYAVSGGIPFTGLAYNYKAESSNQSLVTATVIGSSITINALPSVVGATAGGSANVIVTDSKGTTLTIAVTVPAPVALFTTAPANLTMSSGVALTYAISGGYPNYTVSSSNPAVVGVTQSGATGASYTLTPVTGASGAAVITMTDSKGTTVNITATVPAAPALVSTAPTNLTLANGSAAATYYISGGVQIAGVKPYSVVSSNAAVVAVVEPSTADGKFTLQGISTGAASVVITDAAGVHITLAVTVPAPNTLFTTAPSSLIVASGTSNFYNVIGGLKAYVVKSSNPLVATAVVNATGDLTITGVATGTATVAVSDSLGAVVSIAVSVPAPGVVFTDAPASLTLASGNLNTYSIYGGTQVVPVGPGTAKYNLANSNATVVNASISGTTLSLTGLAAGTATLNISDAAGQKTSIGVTVTATNALMTTAPSSLTVVAAQAAGTYVYAIAGGTKDSSGGINYTVTSSNPAVVSVNARAVTALTFELTGVATGSANVVVADTSGNTVTIAVTVPAPVALFTTAPSSLAIAMGPAKAFAVFGGTQPYTVVNTNPSVASGSFGATPSTLSITGSAVGTASLIVSDAKGASVTIAVTVTSPGKLYTSAPASITVVASTGVDTFSINGGAPTYTVSSSNLLVAAVSMPDATSLRIQGGVSGSAVVTVTDSAGATVTIAITVPAADALFTNAPSTINITQLASPLTYAISGGYPPYAARSADSGIVTANVVGVSGLSISAVNSSAAVNGGSTSVLVSDSHGQTVTIQVKIGSSTALFTDAPIKAGGVTIAVLSTNTYMLNGGTAFQNGGTASYLVQSTNPGVVSATVVGPVLTVVGNAAGTGTIEVTDAIGTKLDILFTVGTGSSSSSTNTYPTLTSVLQTSAGVATSSIDATGYNLLQVTLKDPGNVGIANQLITVTGDPTKLSFPDGQSALTNASGVASIKVTRHDLLATGAGAMTVNYDYQVGMITAYSLGTPPVTPKMVTSYVGYQVTTANISLTNLDVTAATPLAAYGTRQVTVVANITTNGITAPATTTPINVSFSANCGQVSPSTATTDSTGTVLVTFSATDIAGTSPSTLGCSGKAVQITASTSGATAISQSLNVTQAPATSMSFVSASPTRIYLQNSGGVSQSLLTFQLLNQLGEGIKGQQVQLTLKTLNGGAIPNYSGIPNAAFDTAGNTTLLPLTTDGSGKISQAIYAGIVPASVIVNAALVSDATININSSVLAISSGRPVQSRLSLSIAKSAIEGFSVDGTSTTARLFMSDRQGNPVPDGTAVNMVVESGGATLTTGTCTTGTVAPGDSSCTLTIVSGGTRPANGLVTVLAYAVGEEDFTDTNGDNMYTCGEPFTDLGNAYRDDSMTSTGLNAYVGGDFTVPRDMLVTPSCALGGVTAGNGVPGTFDGIWGAVDVRAQAPLVMATGQANITQPIPITANALTLNLADLNGNSLPTGTSVAFTTADNTSLNSLTCTVVSGASTTVPNSLVPVTIAALLGGCATGDLVTVTVTSPLGVVTSRGYLVP